MHEDAGEVAHASAMPIILLVQIAAQKRIRQRCCDFLASDNCPLHFRDDRHSYPSFAKGVTARRADFGISGRRRREANAHKPSTTHRFCRDATGRKMRCHHRSLSKVSAITITVPIKSAQYIPITDENVNSKTDTLLA